MNRYDVRYPDRNVFAFGNRSEESDFCLEDLVFFHHRLVEAVQPSTPQSSAARQNRSRLGEKHAFGICGDEAAETTGVRPQTQGGG